MPADAHQPEQDQTRDAPVSRRDLRTRGHHPAAPTGRPARIVIARTLISATLVVSFTTISYRDAAPSAEAVTVAVGPTVVESLLAVPVDTTVPIKLLAGPSRSAERVSRSLARETVPGCDGIATGEGENGRVPASELCDL